MSQTIRSGVCLPDGQTASRFVGQIFQAMGNRFPGTHALVANLKPSKNLGDTLNRYESKRHSLRENQKPIGAEIPRVATLCEQGKMEFCDSQGRGEPLDKYMALAKASPLKTSQRKPATPFRAMPARLPFEGRIYEGPEIERVVDILRQRHVGTEAAYQALTWMASRGTFDLRDLKLVANGAAAELAPSEVFSYFGATVLWNDRILPTDEVIGRWTLQNGMIVFPEQGADLLAQPAQIRATAEEFAGRKKVIVGNFAYVGGQAREWRLTAAMNAIVLGMNPNLVEGVGLLISPTSPAEVQPENAKISLGRLAEKRTILERALRFAGQLKPNLISHQENDGTTSYWGQLIVPIQGASYLAAQYFGKRLFAENLAIFGLGNGPVTVSANVAPISRTRSMELPLFQLAFAGAPELGITISDPITTRWLSGLLMIHDFLNRNAPGQARNQFDGDTRAKSHAIFSQQLHNGTHGLPFALEGTLTQVALMGTTKRPDLIWPAVRSLVG